MIIKTTDICAECGHSFHEHGWNIPMEQSELEEHTDCKAMVGWYCGKCKTLLKGVVLTIIKEGILVEYKRTCATCGEEVFESQCECCNFEKVK